MYVHFINLLKCIGIFILYISSILFFFLFEQIDIYDCIRYTQYTYWIFLCIFCVFIVQQIYIGIKETTTEFFLFTPFVISILYSLFGSWLILVLAFTDPYVNSTNQIWLMILVCKWFHILMWALFIWFGQLIYFFIFIEIIYRIQDDFYCLWFFDLNYVILLFISFYPVFILHDYILQIFQFLFQII